MFSILRCMLSAATIAYAFAGEPRSGMRFVVHKGMEGFGDRFQQFFMVLQYAKVTQRILVLDWSGDYWSRDPSLGFDNLFELHGVKHFQLSEFLQLWPHLKEHVKVQPPAWAYRMDIPPYDEAYKPLFLLGTDTTNKIADITSYKRIDYDEEIVVYGGTGFRSYSITVIDNFRFHPHIMWYFAEEIRKIALPDQYVAVHLRGGDKLWHCESSLDLPSDQCVENDQGHCDGTRVVLGGRRDSSKVAWGDADGYLAEAASKLEKLNVPDLPVILFSDSPCLVQKWKDQGLAGEPSTRLEIQEAERSRILNTLWDFMLMARAAHLVHDGLSTMSGMAAFIGQDRGNWMTTFGA